MYFPVHIRMVRETYELHQLLPEHYPEFYRTFLVIAEARDPIGFTDVQDRTQATPSTSSRIIYQLADHGLAEVSLGRGDRRRKTVKLTGKGKRILGEIMRRFSEITQLEKIWQSEWSKTNGLST